MINLIDQSQMIQQMADFQKTAFDNSFSAMEIYQNRLEKFMRMFFNHTEWVAEKWGVAITDWTNAYQTGFDAVKKTAENNFSKFEGLLSGQPLK